VSTDDDPCIHGPGVAHCGHPDCVGYRDAQAGRFNCVDCLAKPGIKWRGIPDLLCEECLVRAIDKELRDFMH
jgi:hypothetical protein